VALTLVACASDERREASEPSSTTTITITEPAASTAHSDRWEPGTTVGRLPSGRWIPPPVAAWQWVLSHPLDLSDPSDMGTSTFDYEGAPAPDPSVYDIDGFDNSADTVAALHAAGKRVICYIETGAWEDYRSDAAEFPSDVLGRKVSDYPAERYLDIRSSVVLNLIKTRIKMCADKGFDAIEPDIDDSYTEETGFPITRDDNLAFNRQIAEYAHSVGLSIGLKNGDEPAFAAAMEPFVDFALVEQCFEFRTCESYVPFTRNGKAVFEVEYNLDTKDFCPEANALGFNAVKHDVDLAGGRHPCR
jgi:hypothetical protein